MERLIGTYIFDPVMTEGKMIFLSGPRQVGKTTFAQMWLDSTDTEGTYFNWDDPSVMVEYRRNPIYLKNFIEDRFENEPIPVVFDEIHKHREWRNILKGLYDTTKDRMQLLVTGSGRLDYFQKSGDSLLGRYFSYQMFPLGLPEATGDFSHIIEATQNKNIFKDGLESTQLSRNVKTGGRREALDLLLKFGGFPEPFLKGSEEFHRRWQKDYRILITREEVRDLSQIQDIKGIETLAEILPTKVGSRLSIKSLREDLGYHHVTVSKWINILESLFLVFTIRPWHRNVARAIKKDKKLYFFDWSMVKDKGSRFENLIAMSLLRMTIRLTEKGLGEYEVRYIRDREKREVDFVLVKDKEPIALFEAREGGRDVNKHGRFFSEKLGIPFYQIVNHADKIEAFPGDCYIIPADNFLMLTG